jgi:hypothetical protein
MKHFGPYGVALGQWYNERKLRHEIQHNDIQHNDTQHYAFMLKFANKPIMLSVVMLNSIMLNVMTPRK